MTGMDRRSALAFGLTAAGTRLAPARAVQSQPRDDATSPSLARSDPVVFWSNVSLDLVALDHSIDAADARAPGPCASSRALGLAHAVLADAVRLAYPSAQYEAYFKGSHSGGPIRTPALFVGGAVSSMLRHIYSSTIHAGLIDLRRREFLRMHGGEDLGDWRLGSDYGSDPAFRNRWDWPMIWALVNPGDDTYRPGPRQHDTDPYNCAQGFYGQRWGEEPPLVLTDREVTTGCAPPPPPPEGSNEYETDLAEVRVLGALHGTPADPRRTRDQIDVGLFWAYDGARLLGTPPRLYNRAVLDVARADRMSTTELARLLALCNLAMADAGIVSWRAKYHYKMWRPVLGIRKHRRLADENWRPLGSPRTNRPDFVLHRPWLPLRASNKAGPRCEADPAYAAAAFTPNFPSYPAAHAAFGSACFDMLRKVRAERALTSADPGALDIEIVSEEVDGLSVDNFRNRLRPRRVGRFVTIGDMVEANKRSRVYLGVHWNFDSEGGDASGRKTSDVVYRRAYRRT